MLLWPHDPAKHMDPWGCKVAQAELENLTDAAQVVLRGIGCAQVLKTGLRKQLIEQWATERTTEAAAQDPYSSFLF